MSVGDLCAQQDDAQTTLRLQQARNAESEEQTGRDTTKGPEQPLGQRDAVKADSTPATDDPGQPSAEKSAP